MFHHLVYQIFLFVYTWLFFCIAVDFVSLNVGEFVFAINCVSLNMDDFVFAIAFYFHILISFLVVLSL